MGNSNLRLYGQNTIYIYKVFTEANQGEFNEKKHLFGTAKLANMRYRPWLQPGIQLCNGDEFCHRQVTEN